MLDHISAIKRPIRIVNKTFAIEGVAPDDGYFRTLRDGYDGNFERICRMFIGAEDVCIDVGANIGMTALMMAQFGRRVIAIEGGPSVAEVLARNCRQQPNITTDHCAVADKDGEIHFSEGSAGGHVDDNGVPVPAKRLATIVVDHGVERMDFLKIDVEGFEAVILRDSLDLIDAHRALVFFEFSSLAQLVFGTVNPREFANWITSHFAYVYLVRRSGIPTFLERVGKGESGAHALLCANLRLDNAVTDILATNAVEKLVGRVDLSIAKSQVQNEWLLGLSETEKTMRASTSWRITAPLRGLRMTIGRARLTRPGRFGSGHFGR